MGSGVFEGEGERLLGYCAELVTAVTEGKCPWCQEM